MRTMREKRETVEVPASRAVAPSWIGPTGLRLVLALDGVRLTEPLGYVELSALARPARGACAIDGACSISRRAA
jgi:hypothetical protein